VTSVLKNPAGGADPKGKADEPGESVMHVLKSIAMNSRCHGCGARHGLVRLLGYGRDLMLAVWAIGVLAFCVAGVAEAML
jgi:hypothetical protein